MIWQEKEDGDLVEFDEVPDKVYDAAIEVPCTVEHCKTKKRKRIPGGKYGQDRFEYPPSVGTTRVATTG